MKKIILFFIYLFLQSVFNILFAQLTNPHYFNLSCGSISQYSHPNNDNTPENLTVLNSINSANATYGTVQYATNSFSLISPCDGYTSTTAYDVHYQFTATGNTAVIRIQPSINFDPAIFVSGVFGDPPMICSDHAGGNGQAEEILLNSLVPGATYYIRVYDYNTSNNINSAQQCFYIWVAEPIAKLEFTLCPIIRPNPLVQYGLIDTCYFVVKNTGTIKLAPANILVELEQQQMLYPIHLDEYSVDVNQEDTVFFTDVDLDAQEQGVHNVNISYTYFDAYGMDQTESVQAGVCTPPFHVTIIDNVLTNTTKPKLLAPGSNIVTPAKVVNSLAPTFRFRRVSATSSYTAVLEQYSNINNSIVNIITQPVTANATTPPVFQFANLPNASLELNTIYRWYIIANLANSTHHSDTFYFKTPIAANSNCGGITDINTALEPTLSVAANFLCQRGIITPKNYGVTNSLGVKPNDAIQRGDLAWMAVAGLYKHKFLLPKDLYTKWYPVPFYDMSVLQTAAPNQFEYFKYAKFLTYLDFGDDVTPFGCVQYNFKPYNPLHQDTALQVLLETFNITPATGQSYYSKASSLGIVVAADNYNANANTSRKQWFIWLYRIMTLPNLVRPSTTDLTNSANFLHPGHYGKDNFTDVAGTDDGAFQFATPSAFSLPNYTLPIQFGATYNSEGANMPDDLYPNLPFGTKGWTHNLHSYIIQKEGYSHTTWIGGISYIIKVPTTICVFFPGTLFPHIWKRATNDVLTAETKGLTYTMVFSNAGNRITISTPNETDYVFEKFGTEKIWMLSKLQDRNDNQIHFDYQFAGNGLFRLKAVNGTENANGNLINPDWKLDFYYANGGTAITSVEGPDGNGGLKSISFDYNSDDQLEVYQDLLGNETTFTYAQGNNDPRCDFIVEVELPKGNQIDASYQKRKANSIKTHTSSSSVPTSEVKILSTFNYLTGKITKQVSQYANNTLQSQKTQIRPQMGKGKDGQSPIENVVIKRHSGQDTTIVYKYENKSFPSTPTKIISFGLETAYTLNSKGLPTDMKISKNGTVYKHYQWLYTSNNYFVQTFKRYCSTCPTTWQSMQLLYDNKYNVTEIRDFNYINTQKSVQIQYTNRGIPSKYIGMYGTQTTIYDNNGDGLPDSVKDALNNEWQFLYDDAGKQIEVIDPRGNSTEIEYFDDDLPQTVKNTLNGVQTQVSYNYDANRNLINFENARGKNTIMTYENETDLLTQVELGNSKEEFQYYKSGMLKKHIVHKNSGTKEFEYEYYDNNLLKTDGYVHYDYNSGTQNLTSLTYEHQSGPNSPNASAGASITYDEYDDLNRLLEYTIHYPASLGINSATVKLEYDANDNIRKRIYAPGKAVTYEYDNNDELIKVTDWLGNQYIANRWADGRIKYVDYPNNIRHQYDYDNALRLNHLKIYNKSTNSVIGEWTFELDEMGQHTSESAKQPLPVPLLPNVDISYSSFTDENRISTATNVLTSTNTAYAFDKDGTFSSGTHFHNTTWNIDESLTHIESLNGNFTANYYYLPNGMRIGANRNGQERAYQLDITGMGDILTEYDGNGNPLYYYIHGFGLMARIDANASSSSTRFYHSDVRGSVIAMTRPNATISHKYAYTAYGDIADIEEENFNPFRYVGALGVMYEDSAFYFMRARYYDAGEQRFLSEDPIWAENLYSYAGNNPVMAVDASGEYANIIAGAVIGGVIGGISGFISAKIEGKTGKDLWKNVAVGAGMGAIQGGLAASGIGLVNLTLISALLSPAETALTEEDPTTMDYLTNMGISAASTYIGGKTFGTGKMKAPDGVADKSMIKYVGRHIVNEYTKEGVLKENLFDIGLNATVDIFKEGFNQSKNTSTIALPYNMSGVSNFNMNISFPRNYNASNMCRK